MGRGWIFVNWHGLYQLVHTFVCAHLMSMVFSFLISKSFFFFGYHLSHSLLQRFNNWRGEHITTFVLKLTDTFVKLWSLRSTISKFSFNFFWDCGVDRCGFLAFTASAIAIYELTFRNHINAAFYRCEFMRLRCG